MSLINTLNIGRSALAAQQAAIQITGNNIANSGNDGYTRQTADLTPAGDYRIGQGFLVGSGVNLDSITRNIDQALEQRLRGGTSDASSADTTQQWMSRLEAVYNELGDNDLSTKLGTFFKGWSDLANAPQDAGKRQIVVQNGEAVASWIKDVRTSIGNLKSDINDQLKSQVDVADKLAQQAADLNGQISKAEGGGGGTANDLRDQRDAVLKQLAQLTDIHTVEDGSNTNVYIGSAPLVLGNVNRGITLAQDTDANGAPTTTVTFKTNGAPINASSGQLAALSKSRDAISGYADELDGIAGKLINEVNKIHAAGQGLEGFSSVTSTTQVADASAALNSKEAGLDFKPANGSFVVHVKDKATGSVTSTLVKIDEDGLNNDDTTLNSLAATLGGITNVNASVVGGKLNIAAGSSAVEVSFSQDDSGTLAALGVNTFFTGNSGLTMGVNDTVANNVNLLAAAKNGQPADNQTALALAALGTQKLSSLNGASIADTYTNMVGRVGLSAQDAATNAEASKTVVDTLDAQRQSLSGVSLDEESVNLIKQQRAFQGASRLISAVDEMMQTILQLV